MINGFLIKFFLILQFSGLNFVYAESTPVPQALPLNKIDFETCNCINEEYTHSLTDPYLQVEKSKSFFQKCLDLVGAVMPLSGAREIYDALSIPKECYLASGLSKSKRDGLGQYRVCNPPGEQPSTNKKLHEDDLFNAKNCPRDSKGKEQKIKPHAPCLNEDYVTLTKKAFEDTLRCVDMEPKDIFPLVHHESRFHSNAISSTGAACYGQLIGSAAHQINTENLIGKLKLEKKCPNVHKYFSPLTVKCTGPKDKLSCSIQDIKSKCNVVENPYTCMLYSALNFKLQKDETEAITREMSVFVSENGNKTSFYTTKASGEKNKASEKSVFAETHRVEELVQLWGYNGGSFGINVLYGEFLRVMRGELANPANKSLRDEFKKNNGLKTSTFFKKFKNFVYSNYRWPKNVTEKRRSEVANFVENIRDDLYNLEMKVSPTGHACSDPNSFINKIGEEI